MPSHCRVNPQANISAIPARIPRRWCWRRNMCPECGGRTFGTSVVWSKIGAKNPFICGLAQDGTPLAAGLHNTTPEDLLRYTMIYTPSWNVVSDEQIISDRLLKSIQTMGNPEAYKGSTESNTAPTGSAKSRPTTRPSGTMSSATAPCSSTGTWGRDMSIPPAISVECISAWLPTRMKFRGSIIRRDICAKSGLRNK